MPKLCRDVMAEAFMRNKTKQVLPTSLPLSTLALNYEPHSSCRLRDNVRMVKTVPVSCANGARVLPCNIHVIS